MGCCSSKRDAEVVYSPRKAGSHQASQKQPVAKEEKIHRPKSIIVPIRTDTVASAPVHPTPQHATHGAPSSTAVTPIGSSEKVLLKRMQSAHFGRKTVTISSLETEVAPSVHAKDRKLRIEARNETCFPVRLIVTYTCAKSPLQIHEEMIMGGRLNKITLYGFEIAGVEGTQGWYRTVLLGPFSSPSLFLHFEAATKTKRYIRPGTDSSDTFVGSGCVMADEKVKRDVAFLKRSKSSPQLHPAMLSFPLQSPATSTGRSPLILPGTCVDEPHTTESSRRSSISSGNEAHNHVHSREATHDLSHSPSTMNLHGMAVRWPVAMAAAADAAQKLLEEPNFCVLMYEPEDSEGKPANSNSARGESHHTPSKSHSGPMYKKTAPCPQCPRPPVFSKPVLRRPRVACFSGRHSGSYSTLVPEMEG